MTVQFPVENIGQEVPFVSLITTTQRRSQSALEAAYQGFAVISLETETESVYGHAPQESLFPPPLADGDGQTRFSFHALLADPASIRWHRLELRGWLTGEGSI
jgi:hypothetical protein